MTKNAVKENTKNAIRCISAKKALVTKAFAKKAVIFGTEEYKLWKAYREDYPDAVMVTKKIKKNPNKRTYKNLTYANMERFIREQKPLLLDEFSKQKRLSKVQENPYRAVLAWFLEQFPNYDEYKEYFKSQKKEEPEYEMVFDDSEDEAAA